MTGQVYRPWRVESIPRVNSSKMPAWQPRTTTRSATRTKWKWTPPARTGRGHRGVVGILVGGGRAWWPV